MLLRSIIMKKTREVLAQLLFGWGCTTGTPHHCTTVVSVPALTPPWPSPRPRPSSSSPHIAPTHLGLAGKSLLSLWPLSPGLTPALTHHSAPWLLAVMVTCLAIVGLPANLPCWSTQTFLPHSNTSIKTNPLNQQEKNEEKSVVYWY